MGSTPHTILDRSIGTGIRHVMKTDRQGACFGIGQIAPSFTEWLNTYNQVELIEED